VNNSSSSPSAAVIAFFLVIIVCLLAAIIKCWSISRRPTTNFKSVFSLMLFFTGWLAFFGMACLGGLTKSQGQIPSRPPGVYVCIMLGSLLWMGLLLASFIFALIGLIECTNTRNRFRQGLVQSISTLVLCVLTGMLMVVGMAMRQSQRGLLSGQPTTGVPIVFQDLNFKFSPPGRPWAQADAAKLNRYANLAFLRSRPDVYFMVIAEKDGVANLSTETLAELADTRMRSVSDSFKTLERSPRRVGRLNGLEVRLSAQLGVGQLYYVKWFCATNGWAYQLLTWGRIEDRRFVENEAQQMMARFDVIDPMRNPPMSRSDEFTDFVSTNFHFAVHFASSDWSAWRTIDKNCQYANFGMLRRDDAALVVSAVFLKGLEVRPDIIYRGILTGTGLGMNQDILSTARSVTESGLQGIETTFNQRMQAGSDCTYRVKILQGGGFAYLIVGWADRANTNTDKSIADAFSRVEILPSSSAAPDSSALSAREKRVQRMLLNGIGLAYSREQQYEQSQRFFEAVLEVGDVSKEMPYLSNLSDALMGAGKHREALNALERYPEMVEAQTSLQATRAYLQGRLGQTEAALTNYARLFENGYTSEEYFKDYIGLLANSGQIEEGFVLTEAYLRRQDTPALRLLQASLLKQQKKFDQAVELLQKQHEQHPFHAGISYALGDAFILAGRPNDALTLTKDLLKDQNTASSWMIKGRAEFALKWYREAKDSFEHALNKAPGDPDIKYFVELASQTLGEGENTSVKDPIEPVSVPSELAETAKTENNYGRDEGAYYSRRMSAVSFKRGKELKRTDYYSIHTINAAGVSAFSTFQIAFHPIAEQLYINRLEVRDASGSLVSTGRVSNYYLLEDHSVFGTSSRKVLNMPVPGLQPGYSLEVVATRREIGSPKEFTFLPFVFSQAFPVQESILYLTGDTGSVRSAASPSIKAESVDQGLCWRWKDPPLARWEPLAPSTADYLPMLWLADASSRWPQLVTNYLAEIAERLVLPKEQSDLALKLTDSATNDAQKVAAIARHLQTNYTYKAIEFGRRARIPQHLPEIIRNKYGDCKDHAVLAQQMLCAAGVPATLALVSFNSAIREDLPSLDQFDHMVVHVPLAGKDFFLDCTAKSADLTALWTFGLSGRQSLLLDPDNPRFVRIPAYPTNSSSIHVTRSIALTNATDALVHEDLAFNGVIGGYMRQYLRNQPASTRRAYIAAEFVGSFGELLDMTVKGLDQPESACDVTLTYLVRGQFQGLEKQIVGNLPVGFERTFLLNQPTEKRTSPFEVAAPLLIDAAVAMSLPSNLKAKPPPDPRQSAEGRFVNCNVVTETSDHGWHVSYHLAESAGRFPPGDFSSHCRALQQAVDLLGPRLIATAEEPALLKSSVR
jgi:tetratricopeptide (TPR) repeat protein